MTTLHIAMQITGIFWQLKLAELEVSTRDKYSIRILTKRMQTRNITYHVL